MKFSLFLLFCLFVVFADKTLGSPYIDDEEDSLQVADSDYTDNALENLMRAAQQKRACIRRGGNCDHRPKDCCYSSSCRCNLWGSNCQCQRMGLFQKWG
ncbi:xibalbin-1 isoform X2 [Bombus vancouverensis nearcticus]|uniref:U8-agatoxin-Ao1a-like isoform X2 n=1 Tax=Bombus bifarius TaxID=103933 RepID=A0A6P8MR65_9HYME|nr:U8-agatoxin-Ao1a-like isoform X2 [Bombus vancouverensis nearcticus]XP_033310903.1 U8-agatoxin-Ao1a-like isoform X2 [Bombus bifarius]